MWGKGKIVGALLLLLILVISFMSWNYTEQLSRERQARIESLLMSPEYQNCIYDTTTCPQVEDNIQLPNGLAIIALIITALIVAYLIKSDTIQQKILNELREADRRENDKKRLSTILSVLKEDEKKVLLIVKEQPGVTQNTLRIRTDFSKAKLSTILKELENRGLIKKEPYNKTNKIFSRI